MTDKFKKYNAIYEALVTGLMRNFSVSDTERSLGTVKFLAHFAWMLYPGYLCDLRLEHCIGRIGEEIWKKNKFEIKDYKGVFRRVLHVASETYSTGGHTRLILNLIKGDTLSKHSVVLTRQKAIDCPEWLTSAILHQGGEIISLAEPTFNSTVAVIELQRILCTKADVIFYHIHPDDTIAVAAMAALPRPPIVIINHADHVFWLGSSLADVVACFRTSALHETLVRRYAKKSMLLPLRIDFLENNTLSRHDSRLNLGIKEEDIIVLTVASYYKIIPHENYNYFRLINEALSINPQVQVLVVGTTEKQALNYYKFSNTSRVKFLGLVEDPRMYYASADIYLDSMPIGSFTSILEATYFENFPILAINPPTSLNMASEPFLDGLVTHATNETQCLMFMRDAIGDEDYRRRVCIEISDRVREIHIGENWENYLHDIYQECDRIVENFPYPNYTSFKKEFIFRYGEESMFFRPEYEKNSGEFLPEKISLNRNIFSKKTIINIYINLMFTNNDGKSAMTLRQLFWLLRNI